MTLKVNWTASLLCLAGIVALTIVPREAAAQQAEPNLEMLRRGKALVERLEQGQPTRILAFGDSLTAGWGTDGTHVFHRMFVDCLKHRFPNCVLDYVVYGTPGQTTGEALAIADAAAIARQPDLILLQFGGNDKGWGRRVFEFRRDFAVLIRRLSEETKALVIACLPPIVDEAADNVWSEVARAVAAQEGVPAADLDRAIREGSHDFRGPFPHESHPGSFTHVIMAKEALRAFDLVTGAEPPLRCRLVRESMASADDFYEVRAEITSLADRPVAWAARIEYGQEARTRTGTIEPGSVTVLNERFRVPAGLPAGRSFATPVHLWLRGGDYGSLDVAWLVVAPAVTASRAGPEDLLADIADWHEIGPDALLLGSHLWTGPDDLSGRFGAVVLADRLCFEARVTDDDITVANLQDPSQGDSVELYLDLRSQEFQGEPVYSPEVLALQVIPPLQPWRRTRWRSIEELPGRLDDLVVSAEPTEYGYRVQVQLPLAHIEAPQGEEWGGIGFDVGINDADNRGTRRTQMMWRGIDDNYLDPAYFAGLYAAPLPEGTTRRTLR